MPVSSGRRFAIEAGCDDVVDDGRPTLSQHGDQPLLLCDECVDPSSLAVKELGDRTLLVGWWQRDRHVRQHPTTHRIDRCARAAVLSHQAEERGKVEEEEAAVDVAEVPQYIYTLMSEELSANVVEHLADRTISDGEDRFAVVVEGLGLQGDRGTDDERVFAVRFGVDGVPGAGRKSAEVAQYLSLSTQ